MQAHELSCPQHGGQDMVQKVSAIIAMGTSRGSYSGPTGGVTYDSDGWGGFGGYTTLSGSSMSLLAQKLPPPASLKNRALTAVLFFWPLWVDSSSY